jgi:hypothetical protein
MSLKWLRGRAMKKALADEWCVYPSAKGQGCHQFGRWPLREIRWLSLVSAGFCITSQMWWCLFLIVVYSIR